MLPLNTQAIICATLAIPVPILAGLVPEFGSRLADPNKRLPLFAVCISIFIIGIAIHGLGLTYFRTIFIFSLPIYQITLIQIAYKIWHLRYKRIPTMVSRGSYEVPILDRLMAVSIIILGVAPTFFLLKLQ